MNFNGRWVPLEVMDTIVLLWAVVAVVLSIMLFRIARLQTPKKPGQGKPVRHGRKKHASRRKP